jgi:hypothetical protein
MIISHSWLKSKNIRLQANYLNVLRSTPLYSD